MKKIIIFVLAILTIVFYLSIQISYNTSHPLFPMIKDFTINFLWLKTNPFDNFSNQGIKFDKLSSQIFWSLLFFFISSFLKNKFRLLLASLLVIGIWLKNYIFYGGIMDSKIYLNSSIYFLISILILNIFNFIYKDKSVSNS